MGPSGLESAGLEERHVSRAGKDLVPSQVGSGLHLAQCALETTSELPRTSLVSENARAARPGLAWRL